MADGVFTLLASSFTQGLWIVVRYDFNSLSDSDDTV